MPHTINTQTIYREVDGVRHEIPSLRGKDYILTDEDRRDIAERFGGEAKRDIATMVTDARESRDKAEDAEAKATAAKVDVLATKGEIDRVSEEAKERLRQIEEALGRIDEIHEAFATKAEVAEDKVTEVEYKGTIDGIFGGRA